MQRAKFCVECGERLSRRGWRAWLGVRFCDQCTQRLGAVAAFRSLIVGALITAGAFTLGRYLRPAPPPLVIQRAANSPLSDAPVDLTRPANQANQSTEANPKQLSSVASEEGYICGARTQKGTPCKRRVHVPGERCFQHKGLPAMVPVEKLMVKPPNSAK